VDSSLDDIKRALFPTFAPQDIARLDANTTLVRDVHGVSYLPGKEGEERESTRVPTTCLRNKFNTPLFKLVLTKQPPAPAQAFWG